MNETRIETIVNERTHESYKLVHHKSGLELLLYPMDDYKFTSAMFGTNYGSINNCFKTVEDDDFIKVPDGIAHYLEHKLFENEDCDAFELYAQSGADGNAMTGFEHTIYLFTCTENFYDSLKILINLVQNPYFTQENVDKERGIITQEIRMTLDMPQRRCFHNLLNAMYHEHPVRIDIAGTEESIAKITPELLYKCYDAFYDLHNMALSIAGNFEVEKVISICDELLKPCENKHLEISFPQEPDEIVKPRAEEDFGLGQPIFAIGFKCPAYSDECLLKNEIAADFALSLLAGKMSPLYKRLTDEHLISGTFSKEVFDGKGYFCLIFSGESEDPDKVAELILESIENARKNGFDPDDFELLKRGEYGDVIRSMDIPDSCAEAMLYYNFIGEDLFAQERIIEKMTLDDVNKALELFDKDKMTISVLK